MLRRRRGAGRHARERGDPRKFRGFIAAWYRFEDAYTLNSGNASQCDDRIGLGRHLIQGTAASQPLWVANSRNNRPGLRLDGSNDFMSAAFTLVRPETVLLVYKHITIGASGANDAIFDGGTSVGGSFTMALFANNTPQTFMYTGSAVDPVVSANLANGVFSRVTCVFNGASSVLYENEIVKDTGDSGTGQAGGFTLGAAKAGARPTNIEVLEAIVCFVTVPVDVLARIGAGHRAMYEIT